jgi:hypothetical protein
LPAIPISGAAAMRICALGCFPVDEYVIIYRVEEPDLLILHVFRGSRDIEALLRQQEQVPQTLIKERNLVSDALVLCFPLFRGRSVVEVQGSNPHAKHLH